MLMSSKETILVEVVEGVGGRSLYVNDNRVAGPKPFGGGRKIHIFRVKIEDLKEALQGD